MANSSTNSLLGDVSIEDLTEAALRGVERAVAAREGGKGSGFPGTVTVGVTIDPRGGEFESDRPPAKNSADISSLRTNSAISNEAIGRLNDALAEDIERPLAFARSLRTDMTGTMSEVFDLTIEQKNKLTRFSRSNPELVIAVSEALIDILERDRDLDLEVDVRGPVAMSKKGKKEKEDDNKIKFEIKVDADTDGKVKGGVSVTFEF
ncbi:MAG: hypothetical protein AAFR33_07650 [Pseudomonadota bacterium]